MRQLEPEPSRLNERPSEPQNPLSLIPDAPSPVMDQRLPFLRGLLWGTAWATTALTTTLLGLALALFWPSAPKPVTSTPSSVAQEPAESKPADAEKRSPLLSKNFIPYQLGRPVNVLVMGTDRMEGVEPGSAESFSGRSDTILVLRLDPTKNEVNVLSIPRDTQIEIPNFGLTKINHANWFGGPELARTVIESNFGGLEVERYLRVNTDAFRALVDLVGGVRVFVPENMQYTDQTQKLFIDLKAGWQVLNGDQAEQFARFRYDAYGDIGRVQRQQVLMKALREKLTSPQMLQKIPQLIETFQTYVDTNLTVEEMLALAGFGLSLDPEQVRMVMLPGRASEPGEFNASYWLPDAEATSGILTTYFDRPQESQLASTDWSNSETLAAETPSHQPSIAIQDASGEPGKARIIVQYLQTLGYSNVYITDRWPDVQTETQIIVQRGDLQSAQKLQQSLRFGQLEMTSTGDLESDLTIRVGQDAQVKESTLQN